MYFRPAGDKRHIHFTQYNSGDMFSYIQIINVVNIEVNGVNKKKKTIYLFTLFSNKSQKLEYLANISPSVMNLCGIICWSTSFNQKVYGIEFSVSETIYVYKYKYTCYMHRTCITHQPLSSSYVAWWFLVFTWFHNGLKHFHFTGQIDTNVGLYGTFFKV